MNQETKEKIYQEHKAGRGFKEIAFDYNISYPRLSKILREMYKFFKERT